jgi:hypothetical protein
MKRSARELTALWTGHVDIKGRPTLAEGGERYDVFLDDAYLRAMMIKAQRNKRRKCVAGPLIVVFGKKGVQ